MGKLLVIGLVLALTVVVALPAGAAPPERTVWTHDDAEWTLDNPCTDEVDPTLITARTTIRLILRDGVRRITAIKMRITGSGDWTGHGTDTGVELLTGQGETVNHRIMVTNSVTGQKFSYTHRGHFNGITGEWNQGRRVHELRCVKG